MSLFYPDSPKTDPKQDDASVRGAIVTIFTLLVVLGANKLPRLEWWYFKYFQELYLGGYAFIAIFIVATIWFIKKKTRPLIDRIHILDEVGRSRDSILVGATADGVKLYLSEDDRTGHIQVLGATGRGKTESVIIAWMCRDILAGRDVILIDGKGDPDILEAIRIVAEKSSFHPEVKVFDLGNLSQSCATNPLRYGSAQQITDRLFTAFEFQDPYYRAVQYDIAGSIVQLVLEADETVTFKRLYELLTCDTALGKAIAEIKNDALKIKVTKFLSTPIRSREEKLSGLLSQIAPFAVGEVAEIVNGPTADRPEECAISDLVLKNSRPGGLRDQHVFVVLLPTLKYQQLGHQLGKLLLQELGWAIGERSSRSGKNAPFLPVFLDEFAAFVYEGFTSILNKARTSRVALHLSHQSLGDLAVVSPEFAQVVTTNTNVKCILGLNDPESADFMARHLGTETAEKITEQAEQGGMWATRQKTGSVSVREVEAYKIHPNLLKNYTHGKGVLHLPTRRGNVTEEIQFQRVSRGEVYGNE